MYFNIKKTKIMTTESWRNFEMDGEEIEVVADFSFLGALVECEVGRMRRRMRKKDTKEDNAG